MTQASEIQPLRLQVNSLQIPENTAQPVDVVWSDSVKVGLFGAAMGALKEDICELVLYPGEPCELLVKLENLGSYPLVLDVEVEGNFPRSWYRMGGEGNELPVGSKMEIVLYFQLDGDFFENITPQNRGKSLTLDYRGQIQVTYRVGSMAGKLYQQFAPFQLFIRPRSLYMGFLPSIYREIDLVPRILKIFETAFEPDFNIASTLWAYFNPRTTPEAMLSFIAYWVGWELTPVLSLKRQRAMIANALEIYRWRGTRRGLRFYLHLFTGLPLDEDLSEEEKHISIQELGGRGFIVGEAQMGQDTIMGGGQPFHFILRLRYDRDRPLDENLIRKIVDQEKPAFCTYELYLEEEITSDA